MHFWREVSDQLRDYGVLTLQKHPGKGTQQEEVQHSSYDAADNRRVSSFDAQ